MVPLKENMFGRSFNDVDKPQSIIQQQWKNLPQRYMNKTILQRRKGPSPVFLNKGKY